MTKSKISAKAEQDIAISIDKNLMKPIDFKYVNDLVKSIIQETILKLDPEEEMASLKAEKIYAELVRKAAFGPYIYGKIYKKQKLTMWNRRKEYFDRLERLNSITLGKLSNNDEKILNNVTKELQVDKDLLRRGFRQVDYTDARKMLCFIYYKFMGYTLTRVGSILNRDHSTVIHAITSHEDLVETDKRYRTKFYNVLQIIKSKASDLIDPSDVDKLIDYYSKNRDVKFT